MPASSEVRGQRGVWLLDLDVGGRVYRFASEGVIVSDADGESYRYESGLGELSITLTGGAAKSLPVTLSTDVDWALIEARGQSLELQSAIVRRWFPGTVLERATVIIRGLTEGAEYETQYDPMTVTIVRSPSRDSKLVPDAQAVVDSSTFPRAVTGYSIGDKAQGAAYPLIIGAPGHDPKAANPKPAVPALAADFQAGLDDSTLLIADRRIQASTVVLENASLHNFSTAVPVLQREDNLGRVYSYVDFSSAVAQLGEEGDEYWVGFQADTTYGGGTMYRGELVRGAGDVIRFLLEEHSNIDYDRGRFDAVADWLNQYKIDGYINARQEAWAWIEAEILKWLQVVVVDGVDGIFLRPVDYGATTTDAVMWLRSPGNVERVGALAKIREPIYNEFAFDYRAQRGGSKYFDRRMLSAQSGGLSGFGQYLGTVTDERVYASYLCAYSQADFGIRPWNGASKSIWDDATAGLILQGMAERYTYPKRSARYVGGSELEVLERGQVVIVTDAEVYLDEHIAIVDGVTITGAQVALDLILVDHPVYERRAL